MDTRLLKDYIRRWRWIWLGIGIFAVLFTMGGVKEGGMSFNVVMPAIYAMMLFNYERMRGVVRVVGSLPVSSQAACRTFWVEAVVVPMGAITAGAFVGLVFYVLICLLDGQPVEAVWSGLVRVMVVSLLITSGAPLIVAGENPMKRTGPGNIIRNIATFLGFLGVLIGLMKAAVLWDDSVWVQLGVTTGALMVAAVSYYLSPIAFDRARRHPLAGVNSASRASSDGGRQFTWLDGLMSKTWGQGLVTGCVVVAVLGVMGPMMGMVQSATLSESGFMMIGNPFIFIISATALFGACWQWLGASRALMATPMGRAGIARVYLRLPFVMLMPVAIAFAVARIISSGGQVHPVSVALQSGALYISAVGILLVSSYIWMRWHPMAAFGSLMVAAPLFGVPAMLASQSKTGGVWFPLLAAVAVILIVAGQSLLKRVLNNSATPYQTKHSALMGAGMQR